MSKLSSMLSGYTMKFPIDSFQLNKRYHKEIGRRAAAAAASSSVFKEEEMKKSDSSHEREWNERAADDAFQFSYSTLLS
jgi:hypothetical protein